jgi:RNA polymerase sigma-70 factor (ECF subfamily)
MDERELAQGLRQGRADAWRTLYDAYSERVWRTVTRLLGGSSTDVADVVQETFLAAARSARTYDPAKGALWFWLWGIARRQAALHFRRKGRQRRFQAEADGPAALLGWLEGRELAPPRVLASAELAGLVRATLEELSADHAFVLTAFYLDGTPAEEIARQERSTPVAVRSKLARARQAFRAAFSRHLSESDLPQKERT